MHLKFIVDRLIAVPLRHKLIAVAIGVGVFAGCLLWARHLPPQGYTSSSLLSFDEILIAKVDPSGARTDERPAVELAYSILNDDVVNALCKHFDLFPDSSGEVATRFRSSLMFSPESTSNLRVTWSGADRSETVAVTNTIAALLASWVPDDAMHHLANPVSSVPAPVTGTMTSTAPMEPPQTDEVQSGPRRRFETVPNDQNELRIELATADQRLATLADEARRFEARVSRINAEREANLNARQPLMVELAAEKKNLDKLSVRYTDDYPDVVAAQERIAETKQKLTAVPAVSPAPDADQARLNSVAQEINRLRAQKSRLLAQQLSQSVKLENNIRTQEIKDPTQATRPRRASAAQPSTRNRRRLSYHAPPSADRVASSQTSDSTAVEQARPFKILQRADEAQPTTNPSHVLNWLAVVAAPLSGIIYLLLAVWWFRAVCNVETLKKIIPGNISYLGEIPGINL